MVHIKKKNLKKQSFFLKEGKTAWRMDGFGYGDGETFRWGNAWT